MRFSITAASLTALSFAAGSLAQFANTPSYVRTFGVQGGGRGRWRGAPPILLDMETQEIYLPSSPNNLVDPELRFQLVGVSAMGIAITAARLVEYPGYDTADQGYYMSKPANGSLIYSVFDESTDGLGPWWLVRGPDVDPQFRLTFEGSSVAKAWWDASKNRYKVYMGTDIPGNLTGLIDMDMKVTQYCGPGYTYCS
ncbi:hypothetical protein DFP73DRAFT_535376 [Morchella snyderi]|nr:hypothetical protein DFP73DRAFT_535376 [Morchella snyderi]